jgi:hypothetical protein
VQREPEAERSFVCVASVPGVSFSAVMASGRNDGGQWRGGGRLTDWVWLVLSALVPRDGMEDAVVVAG